MLKKLAGTEDGEGTPAKHFEYFIQAVLIINKFLGNHFVTQYNIFSLINKWV